VARKVQEEGVLAERFGMTVTPVLLKTEYDRIERSTKAPEQWDAIKRALGDDRRKLEDVFCRPLWSPERSARASPSTGRSTRSRTRRRARLGRPPTRGA
jgi:hypothetical protein